jgi:hypothetical protein
MAHGNFSFMGGCRMVKAEDSDVITLKTGSLFFHGQFELHGGMEYAADLGGPFLSERDSGRIAWLLRLEIERHPRGSGKDVMDNGIIVFEKDVLVRLNDQRGLRKGIVFLPDYVLASLCGNRSERPDKNSK